MLSPINKDSAWNIHSRHVNTQAYELYREKPLFDGGSFPLAAAPARRVFCYPLA